MSGLPLGIGRPGTQEIGTQTIPSAAKSSRLHESAQVRQKWLEREEADAVPPPRPDTTPAVRGLIALPLLSSPPKALLAEELAACHRAHGAAEVKLYSAKAGHDARLVGEALAEIKAIQQRIEQLQRAKALAAGHLVQLPKSARAKTSFSPSERELRVHHAAPEGWGRAPSSRSGTDRIPASRASSSRGSRGSSAASAVSARRLQRQKERDQKRIRTNTTSRR